MKVELHKEIVIKLSEQEAGKLAGAIAKLKDSPNEIPEWAMILDDLYMKILDAI